jgi:hypothetical protein
MSAVICTDVRSPLHAGRSAGGGAGVDADVAVDGRLRGTCPGSGKAEECRAHEFGRAGCPDSSALTPETPGRPCRRLRTLTAGKGVVPLT